MENYEGIVWFDAFCSLFLPSSRRNLSRKMGWQGIHLQAPLFFFSFPKRKERTEGDRVRKNWFVIIQGVPFSLSDIFMNTDPKKELLMHFIDFLHHYKNNILLFPHWIFSFFNFFYILLLLSLYSVVGTQKDSDSKFYINLLSYSSLRRFIEFISIFIDP